MGDINVIQLSVDCNNLTYNMDKIRYQFDETKPDLVIVSHASNAFGVIAPIEQIFAIAKEYNARTLADMSQTAGLIDVNVGLETFDYAVFAGHKTLYGPTGISGFANESSQQIFRQYCLVELDLILLIKICRNLFHRNMNVEH